MRRSLLLRLLPTGACTAAILGLYPFIPHVPDSCEQTPLTYVSSHSRFLYAAIPVHVAAFLVLLALFLRAANARRAEAELEGEEPPRWPARFSFIMTPILVVALLITVSVPIAGFVMGIGLVILGAIAVLPALLILLMLVSMAIGGFENVEEPAKALQEWHSLYVVFTAIAALMLVPASLSAYLLAVSGPVCLG